MTLVQNLTIGEAWLIPLIIWSLAWKGVALWKCGRNNQLYWFIALLLLNTVGLLEIAYLVWFQKKHVLSKVGRKK
ncbi:hypothetical protein KKA33_04810 [Patescibacteria group bacterium]|nr:hypothetical protein [Patescibacteria group bacterium]